MNQFTLSQFASKDDMYRAMQAEVDALNTKLQCKGCAVQQGTHAPAGALHQITEPAPAVLPAVSVTTPAQRAGHVYVSGPMTGYADLNFPAFNAAAAALRAQGFTVTNPADHGVVPGAEWEDYLRTDLVQLAACEAIHLLPGWSKSKGARLELHVAQALGMRITTEAGAEPAPSAARPLQGEM